MGIILQEARYESIFEPFDHLLQGDHKPEAVEFALDLVASGKIDPITLYTEVLTLH